MNLFPALFVPAVIVIAAGIFVCERGADKPVPRMGYGADSSVGAAVEVLMNDIADIFPGEGIQDDMDLMRNFLSDSGTVSAGSLSADTIPACLAHIFQSIYHRHAVSFDTRQDLLATMVPPLVLRNRRGSCMGVSLLMLMLAEKNGCPLYGVVLPGHFFVRYDNGTLRRNGEPNRGGYAHPDSYYRERYAVPPESPVYLRNLTHRESMAVMRYNVANVCREKGMLDVAAQWYAASIQDFPDYGEAWGNLAITQQQRGRKKDAQMVYEHVWAMAPFLPGLAYNYGMFCLDNRQYRRALDVFTYGKKRWPGDPEYVYGMALTYYGLRDSANCQFYARELNKRFPASRYLETIRSLLKVPPGN